jgi:hypothetical protein
MRHWGPGCLIDPDNGSTLWDERARSASDRIGSAELDVERDLQREAAIMRWAIHISLAVALLACSGSPAVALDIPPGVNPPTIGYGINRVPCDIGESQTPVPFVGSMEDLIHLCPGDLEVQLYWMQTRLLRRHPCYRIVGYAPDGRLVHVRRCFGFHRSRVAGPLRRHKRLRY